MIDHNNKTWTRDGLTVACEDGRKMSIADGMTDDYLLSVIASFDNPPIPLFVDMRQARLALLGAGLLPTVNAAIQSMTGIEGDAARIEWEFAANVNRDSPLISGLSAALGLDDAMLDALFIKAAGL
jgi:hypothetical protein